MPLRPLMKLPKGCRRCYLGAAALTRAEEEEVVGSGLLSRHRIDGLPVAVVCQRCEPSCGTSPY